MKKKIKRHPDYGLKDQAAGRCPYCLASVEMDCDCGKPKRSSNLKTKEE